MRDGTYLEFPSGTDFLGEVIDEVTEIGKPELPVQPGHIAVCVKDIVFDDTWWNEPGYFLPKSGMRETPDWLAASMGNFKVHEPLIPWTPGESERAFLEALSMVNGRSHYNVALLLAFAISYPARKIFGADWVPFAGFRSWVCSTAGARIYRASGRDPWPGRDSQSIVPGDYVGNKEWS